MVNKVFNMDCLEGMQMLPDKSIDMCLTSPPYDNLRTYNNSLRWSFEIFQSIAKILYRVIKDGGVVVWVVGDATIKGSETGTSFKQALYFKEIGFNLHDTMIWEKTGQGAVGSNYSYWQNFEFMFVLSKGKVKSFNPICDRQNKEVGLMVTNSGRKADGSSSKRKIQAKPYGKRFNNWRLNQETRSTEHPAPFPEQLACDHINSWSNENDLILDPFMGSGTTAIACINTGRNYIGFEKEEKYYNIILERIKKHTKQAELFAA